MERRLTNGQIVALVFIALLLGLGALIVSNINANKSSEPTYLKYKKVNGPSLKLVGNYIEYAELGEPYEDKMARCTSNGENLNKKIQTMYLQNDNQVTQVNYNEVGTYQVRYTCIDKKQKVSSISRTVIVADNQAPTISIPGKQIITSEEAVSFNLETDVTASDNSGTSDLKYNNTLSTIPGDYVITYTVKDNAGNKTTRNRLIKVVAGIDFNYQNNKLTINYPNKENYTYKYSLDGGLTWNDATKTTTIDFANGNAIASVYSNGKYIMSNSFTL